jgi:hypothetical protein
MIGHRTIGDAGLWSQDAYRKWLEVEVLVAEGWAEIGRVPKEMAAALRANADRLLSPNFDFGQIVHRTLELEGDVPGFEPKPGQPVIRHDLIAFLTAVSEHLGEEKRYLHFGVTSYDIEDTATNLLLRDSCELIEQDLAPRRPSPHARSTWTPDQPHGMHAADPWAQAGGVAGGGSDRFACARARERRRRQSPARWAATPRSIRALRSTSAAVSAWRFRRRPVRSSSATGTRTT